MTPLDWTSLLQRILRIPEVHVLPPPGNEGVRMTGGRCGVSPDILDSKNITSMTTLPCLVSRSLYLKLTSNHELHRISQLTRCNAILLANCENVSCEDFLPLVQWQDEGGS